MEKPEVNQEPMKQRRTKEEELLFVKSLVGMTITDAEYSEEDGVMLEFDSRIRYRSCCLHSSFFKRRVQ